MQRFCDKIQFSRIIVVMVDQGHVTSFDVSDWFLHSVARMIAANIPKNNIFNFFNMAES